MASDTAVRSNTEIVREYTQRVFNEHNPDLASEYLKPEMKWHGGLLGTVEGAENVTGMLRGFIGALPDLHAAEQDMVAAGETVAVRYVVEATHEGESSRDRADRSPGAVGRCRRLPPCGRDDRRGVGRRRHGGDPVSRRRVHPAVALGKSRENDPGRSRIGHGDGLAAGPRPSPGFQAIEPFIGARAFGIPPAEASRDDR
jgi:SnoaL-like protein